MSEKFSFGANISADEVLSQYESEQIAPAKKMQFDTKNYLQARLGPTEQTKVLTIRLLPFSPDGGTPFKKVRMHTVKVNKEVSPSGWKTFVCPIHNDVDGKKMGDRCPFCELSTHAMNLKRQSEDEVMRKKYGDVEFQNRARDMWIVRCIERGHEEDGVKFWLFGDSKKKDGVYDKIYNLTQQRKKESDYNILDLDTGKDLVVTLSKNSNNQTTVQIIDAGVPSPLTNDYEKGKSWIEDGKKWYDVYTVKPYEYMDIISAGGVPYYNKETGKYYDKSQQQEVAEEASAQPQMEVPVDTFKVVGPPTSNGGEPDDDLPF